MSVRSRNDSQFVYAQSKSIGPALRTMSTQIRLDLLLDRSVTVHHATQAGHTLLVADDRAKCPASGGGRPRDRRAARDPGDHLVTKKPRLTDLQLVLLSSAAQRPDGMLLPLPETIRAKGKTLERSLTKMLGLGLIEECPARTPERIWRNDDDGHRIALRISTAGQEVLGLDAAPTDVEDSASPDSDPSKDKVFAAAIGDTSKAEGTVEAGIAPLPSSAGPSVKPGTKQTQLVEHLSRPGGASIADLGGLLGWQPHTVRAALTGLRKKGYRITNARDAFDVTVYRVTPPAEATDHAA